MQNNNVDKINDEQGIFTCPAYYKNISTEVFNLLIRLSLPIILSEVRLFPVV
jgi:hypothetical protein